MKLLCSFQLETRFYSNGASIYFLCLLQRWAKPGVGVWRFFWSRSGFYIGVGVWNQILKWEPKLTPA